MYTVVFQTRSCRRVKQNRDQEGKENKVTNGNTLYRAKVLTKHVQNARQEFVSNHQDWITCWKMQLQEAAFEILDGIYLLCH